MRYLRFFLPRIALAVVAFGGSSAVGLTPGRAQGSIATGKNIATNGNADGAPACSACHGANGEGQPAAGIPRLAGLDAAYLKRQLVVFGTGMRDNPMMSPVSKTLTPKAMADLAAFYATLSAPKASDPVKQTAQIKMGEALALHGDWSVALPACASCHGVNGLGVGRAFPPVAGQSATYLTNQLAAWKAGTRHDDPLGLMKTIAGRLSDNQIAAVAAYYETMPASVASEGPKP